MYCPLQYTKLWNWNPRNGLPEKKITYCKLAYGIFQNILLAGSQCMVFIVCFQKSLYQNPTLWLKQLVFHFSAGAAGAITLNVALPF